MDITELCTIHGDKMYEEGWYTTTFVLDRARLEIERLRMAVAYWMAEAVLRGDGFKL